MISVIISTFNRKKLLEKTIQSVLNQSQECEIIVVDDCSTDGTDKLSILKKVKYLKTDKNSGSDSLPKNIGIREAKGEYIAFLDDDDVYRRDALKILFKYAQATNADVVYGDYLIDGKIGWSLDFSASLLQKMNFISMPVVLVRKSALLEVGGFDENIHKFKDWNIWMRMQKRGYKFMHIPIIVSEVSTQTDSISNNIKTEMDEEGRHIPTFSPADCNIYADKTILGEKKPLKVAIFTMTKDRLEYTKQMAEAMYKTAGYPFDWFVIDNGSKDGTVEWLKENTESVFAIIKKLILNPKNEGIARGWNQAVELIKKTDTYDIVIKIDNDNLMMTQDWLKIMIELFEKNRTMILSPYVEGLEDSPGGVLRQRQGGMPYVSIGDRVLGLVPYLGGICWAAPIEVYDEFKFEENTFLAGNKDYMISQYARSLGYTLFYVEETRCWHIGGTKGQKERYPEYFKEIEKAREEKGGIF